MTLPHTSQSRAGGTGLIKVITLKPVTESTNRTNTGALQMWEVVGMPSR